MKIPASPSSFLLIGHRGAMGHAPENTRAAFVRGLGLGADAVECDVHLSRDGRLVVIHDDTLERTTDGQGRVADRPWSYLRRRDAGSWFGSRFAGERLWRLDDLLAWAARRRSRAGRPLQIIVEIKKSPRRASGIADKVVEALQRARMTGRALVISFDHAAVRRAKRLDPALPTGLLFSSPIKNSERRMGWARADAIFPRHSLVTPALMGRARRAGWKVGTWTVNEPREMSRLIGLGVDAIATNYPERLAALRS